MNLNVKIGKKAFYHVDLVKLLSIVHGVSKSQMKRLFLDGAVTIEVVPSTQEEVKITKDAVQPKNKGTQ